MRAIANKCLYVITVPGVQFVPIVGDLLKGSLVAASTLHSSLRFRLSRWRMLRKFSASSAPRSQSVSGCWTGSRSAKSVSTKLRAPPKRVTKRLSTFKVASTTALRRRC